MAVSGFAGNWAEIIAASFMVIGIIVAFLSPSLFISYMIIFLSGMIAGRLLWERRNKTRYPYILIMLAFVAGYMLGTFRHYGNPIIILILFVVGAVLMYKLNQKGILADLFF